MKIRKPYKESDRHRVSVDFVYPSRAKQSFKNECDINNVLARYDKTGLITHVSKMRGDYFDTTEVNEYQDALNLVISANAQFAELPAEIRKRFGNDPGEFLEFVSDPENIDEMRKLGLAKELEHPEPAPQEAAQSDQAQVPDSGSGPVAT